jgi:hypothetical protein
VWVSGVLSSPGSYFHRHEWREVNVNELGLVLVELLIARIAGMSADRRPLYENVTGRH